MIRIRERSPALILLAGLVLAYIAGTSLYAIGLAHGDPAPAAHVMVEQVPPAVYTIAPAPALAAPASDTSGALAVIALVVGGLGMILGGLSTVLHAIASRTKTQLDDRLAAGVDDLHAKLDGLLALVGLRGADPTPARAPSSTTVNVTTPEAGRTSVLQAGHASLLVMALLAVGGLGLVFAPSCSWQQVKSDEQVGKAAVVACAKADAAPIMALLVEFAVDALASTGDTGTIAWGPLETKAIAQGEVTGGCALKRFVEGVAAAPAPTTVARTLLPVPDTAAAGRAALARVSSHFGGVTWQVAGG